MSRIKVFNTPNAKEQEFLNYWDWDLIHHPKFPIPNLSFTHEEQPNHFKKDLITKLNPNEFNISFFGSGDYHYLCLPLLELQEKPFYLIMIDNHYDTGNVGIPTSKFTEKIGLLSRDHVSWGGCGYDCGSWLWPAIKLPNCNGVLHLGANQEWPSSLSHFGFPPKIFPEGFRYSYEDRLNGIPYLQKNYNFKYLKNDFRKLDEYIDAIEPNINIYITIDKDVLHRKELTTDYGQGKMKIKTLYEILQKIIDKRSNNIVGVDVCGEPVIGFNDWDPLMSSKVFSKFTRNKSVKVGDIGTFKYNQYMRPYLKPHSKVNDKICRLFEKFIKN